MDSGFPSTVSTTVSGTASSLMVSYSGILVLLTAPSKPADPSALSTGSFTENASISGSASDPLSLTSLTVSCE